MTYRLLIFDFDGTLADSFPTFARHFHAVVERFGLRPISDEEMLTLRGCGAREVIARVGLPLWKVPLAANYIRGLMAANPTATQLFPGIADLLRGLVAEGVVVAIVSSNSEENVRAVLGPELVSLIRVFECGASLFGKAAKFRSVLRQTGMAPSVTITIGDEIRDHEAAQEAAIAFGAVAWGYTLEHALAARSPEALFRAPSEILALVRDAAPAA